jgi:hypothetical protein
MLVNTPGLHRQLLRLLDVEVERHEQRPQRAVNRVIGSREVARLVSTVAPLFSGLPQQLDRPRDIRAERCPEVPFAGIE